MKSYRARLAALEKEHAQPWTWAHARLATVAAEHEDRERQVLAAVPRDLLPAVRESAGMNREIPPCPPGEHPLRHGIKACIEATCSGRYPLLSADWIQNAFAEWAWPIPKGFQFPRVLMEWMLDPANRGFRMGYTCTACGLVVPTPKRADGEPPPPDVFPLCPACGAPTAYYVPPPANPKEATP